MGQKFYVINPVVNLLRDEESGTVTTRRDGWADRKEEEEGEEDVK